MTFLTTPILYGLAGLALAAGTFAGVQTLRLANERTDYAEHLAADKAAEAGALQDARVAEQDKAAELAAVAEQYEQDKRNDQAAADRLAADLRRGNVRLRDEWAGCETDNLSGAAASAAELDAARELRNAAAGAVIQVGRDADAKERALQATVRADRGTP